MTKEELKQEFSIKETAKGIAIIRWYGKDVNCVIPHDMNIVRIERYAFWNCDTMAGISIPSSVANIDDGAFSGCNGLKHFHVSKNNPFYSSVDGVLFDKEKTELLRYPVGRQGVYRIPDGVTGIGKLAFSGCGNLTGLTIPDSVTSIGESAFQGCTGITTLMIPGSVTSIGEGAFSDCSSLTSLTIPDSVTSIGEWAFSHCSSLTSLTIPDSVTSIGKRVLSDCSSLTSLHIGNGVTDIPDWEFTDLSSLTNVYIGNSVTSIGGWAFSGCGNLTSIHLGDSVVDIGYAFNGCKNLTSITLSKNAVLNERKLPYGVTVTRVSESPETKEAKVKTHSQTTVSKTKVKGKTGEYKKLSETVKISADGTKVLINDQWSFKIPDGISYNVNTTHDTHMSAFSLDSKIKSMVLTFDDCDFSLALNPHFDLRHTYYTADEVRNDNREETGEDGCVQRKVITDDGDLIVDIVVCSLFMFGAQIDIRVRADGIEPFNFSGVIQKSDLDSDGWENTWETIKQRLRYMAESICKETDLTA